MHSSRAAANYQVPAVILNFKPECGGDPLMLCMRPWLALGQDWLQLLGTWLP